MIHSTQTNGVTTNGNLNTTTTNTKALLELESNSSLNRALLSVLKNSFFEKKPLNWKPVKYELVINTKLTEEFQQIKSEFQSSSKEAIEYEEKYAFLVETDQLVSEICQNGYSCQDNFYNVIGQSKCGVYLTRYPDVALKFTENKKGPDQLMVKMVIFKIFYGKQTLALVRKDAKLPPIGATPNFNSHISVIPPKEKDEIEVQYDHSQIYLYELNANKLAVKRPRHCLPYAVITWLKFNDGTEWPHNFNELEGDVNLLITDSLQVALQTEDSYVQTKIKALIKTNLINSTLLTSTLMYGYNHDTINDTNVVEINAENHLNCIVNNMRAEQEIENKITNNDSQSIKNNEINTNCQANVEFTPAETNPINENNENKLIKEKIESIKTTEQSSNEQAVSNENTHLTNGIVNKSDLSNQPIQSESPSNQSTTAAVITPATAENSNIILATTPQPTETNGTTDIPKSETPNSGLAIVAATTPVTNLASTTPTASNGTAITPYQHKTNLSFAKQTFPNYRQNTAMLPYLYATQATHPSHYHPYGALPYGRQIPSTAALQAAALAPFQAAATPTQIQQPVFLCRGPNGLTYLTAAAPNSALAPQQLVAVQQAQAQANAIAAIQQQAAAAAIAAAQAQQVAAIQGQTAATYTAGPTAYSKTNIINPIQQSQQQIIYQAAPQPATTNKNASSSAQSAQTAQQQTAVTAQSMVQPTQSPKQQQSLINSQTQAQTQTPGTVAAQYAAAQYAAAQSAAVAAAASVQPQTQAQQSQPAAIYATQGQINQINQMHQMAAAYSGQPTYFAYAPTASATSNSQNNPTAVAQTTSSAAAAAQQAYLTQAGQQNYMLAAGTGQSAAAVVAVAQQQQLQQMQLQQQLQQQQLLQLQQQQQVNQLYGLSSAGINLTQLQAQGATLAGQQIALPAGIQTNAGYQIIDGIGAVRPRIVNLRHHPYSR